ncbi:hypothetical protein AVEN_126743-1 [Araneus ventricosus]|uniref:Uncharacterized protein n=1 Tax=Araneus ventricosus TaxID=182803 RepID=A0A4Y2NET3_ARAVE|nr:hypothetical protein AVEN_126743-1 [Araneus ventricosus]
MEKLFHLPSNIKCEYVLLRHITTSKLFTIDELIEDILHGNNLSNNGEVVPPSFKYKMWICPPFEFVNCDRDITASKLFTIDELIEYILSGTNLGNDGEVVPPSFKYKM